MSLPVLIGFAGVLVAAVATGMLAGRCVRQPRIGFIVWTAATLGLTIALAAQSMGFASGFGPATFRAVQLFALLLAPLWLAWGLVEVAVASEGARFGVRLISSALTVVATVILATDPLTAQPFSKAWPLTGTHFQPVSRDALDVVQAVAVVVALVTASLAAVRASRGSGPAGDGGRPGRPGRPHDRRAALAAPGRGGVSAAHHDGGGVGVVRCQQGGEPPRRAAARGGSSGGRGEGVRDASGKPGDGYWPDDRAGGDYVPEGQYVTYGQGRPGPARPPGDFPGGPARARCPRVTGAGARGRRRRPPERPDPYRGPGPRGPGELATDERAGTQPVAAPGPEAGAAESGLPGLARRGQFAGRRGRAAVRPDPDLHLARRQGRRVRPARRGDGGARQDR